MKIKDLFKKLYSFKINIYLVSIISVSLIPLILYFITPGQFKGYIMEEKKKVFSECIAIAAPIARNVVENSYFAGKTKMRPESDLINNVFEGYPDYEYYALVFETDEGESKSIIYNEENTKGVEDLFTKEVDQTIFEEKAGKLNIIVPLYSDTPERSESKSGNFVVGFSMESIEDKLRSIKRELLLICLLSLIMGHLLERYLRRILVMPLENAKRLIENVIQGDLTQKLAINSKDEFGKLNNTLNEMVCTWKEKMIGVKKTLEETYVTSNKIEIAADHHNDVTSRVASSINEITSTTKELDASSQQVFEKSRQVADRSSNVLQIASEGQESVDKSLQEFNKINEKVATIARYILNFGDETKQIEYISKAVKTNTSKTEMLAINADIEAAKAGEQGKGFSMVAAEVRALAEQSKSSAVKIASLVAKIQKTIKLTLDVSEQGVQGIEDGIKMILESKRTIKTAVANLNERLNSVNQISISAKQQLLGSEQITHQMVSINEGMKETAHSSSQNMKEAEKLSERYKSIQNLISQYRV